jgi:hypothetical protein
MAEQRLVLFFDLFVRLGGRERTGCATKIDVVPLGDVHDLQCRAGVLLG